jgi:hypothetical protein
MPSVTASTLVVALALGLLAMPPTTDAQQAGKLYRIGRAWTAAPLGPVERSLHEVSLEDLEPDNAGFGPIVLKDVRDDEVRAVAEFLEVLKERP